MSYDQADPHGLERLDDDDNVLFGSNFVHINNVQISSMWSSFCARATGKHEAAAKHEAY